MGLFLFMPSAWGQWQNGDTWYYTLSEEYMPQRFPPLKYDFLKMEIYGDTIVEGLNWKYFHITNSEECNYLRKNFIARYDSGRVYFLHEELNRIAILYDFNLGEGDSLVIPIPDFTDRDLVMLIDSIDSVLVGSELKIRQWVTLKAPNYTDHAADFYTTYPVNQHYIIEGIGSTVNFFLAWDGLCHGKRAYNLRCFSFENQTYHHDNWGACDSVFFWSPNNLIMSEGEELKVYPNPANDWINILTSQSGTISIQDIFGKELYNSSFTNGLVETIPLDHMRPGFYFICLTYVDGHTVIKSFIKGN